MGFSGSEAGGRPFSQQIGRDAEVIFAGQADRDRCAPGKHDHWRIGDPDRFQVNDFISGIDEGL